MRVGREVRQGTLNHVQMSTLWQGSRGWRDGLPEPPPPHSAQIPKCIIWKKTQRWKEVGPACWSSGAQSQGSWGEWDDCPRA